MLLLSTAFAEPFPLVEQTLPNGVRLVAHALPTAADVAIRVYVPRGAALDPEGRAGLAHLVEHVSYTGSEHVYDYDGTLAAVGGTSDGWTTHDAMVFAVTVPVEGLEWAVFLESDRIGRSAPTADAVREQLAVIANERRDTARETATLGALAAALWPADHPYARRVIGEEAGLSDVTLDEVEVLTRRLFAPAGVTVVMVGPDVDTMLDAGRTWFGTIGEGSPLPVVEERREPGRGGGSGASPQTDERASGSTTSAGTSMAGAEGGLSGSVPAKATEEERPRRLWVPADVYPTRLAYGWIVSGDAEAARWTAEVLGRRLAEDGVSAQAWYGREGASFTMMVTTHHPARTDRRVRRTLERLRREGPTAEEIEGARATAWTRAARAAESVDGRADQIVAALEDGRVAELPEVAATPEEVRSYAVDQLGWADAVVVAVVPSTRPGARPAGMVRW